MLYLPATTRRRLQTPCKNVAFPSTTLPPYYVFIKLPDLLMYSIMSLVSHYLLGLCLLVLLYRSGLRRHLFLNLKSCLLIHHSFYKRISSFWSFIVAPFQSRFVPIHQTRHFINYVSSSNVYPYFFV